MQGLEKTEGVAVGAQEGNGWSSLQGGGRGPGKVMQMIESWVLKDKVVSQTEGAVPAHSNPWVWYYSCYNPGHRGGVVWGVHKGPLRMGLTGTGSLNPKFGDRKSISRMNTGFFFSEKQHEKSLYDSLYPSVWLKFSLVRNKWKIITKTAKRDPGVLPRADVLFRKGTLVPWGRGIRRQTSKRDRWGGYTVSQATAADTERNKDQMFQGSNLQAPEWKWAVRAEGAGWCRLE